ncbi:MAG: hypothetical protein EZS28_045533, partial [Streblomastix strix]
HPIGRIPVREPTILEPQWYLNKEVRQGDTGITNQNKLIESEKQDSDEDKDRIIINDMNIGTVLICAGILAMNMMQDVVKSKNNWWTKAFGMNLDLLIQSEITFFIQLDCNVVVERKQFIRLYSLIKQTSES